MEYKRTLGYKSGNYNLRSRCDPCNVCRSCSSSSSRAGKINAPKLEAEIETLKKENIEIKEELEKLKKIISNGCLENVCGKVDFLYRVLNPTIEGITIKSV